MPHAAVKVLYVNHTGQISGAERSLLEILKGLPAGVTALLACPDGPLAQASERVGIARLRIVGTDGSLKLHPRHTAVALWQMARAASQVRGLVGRYRIALTHANSIRAGLLTTAVARSGGPPTVAHVRDRLPAGSVSRLVLRSLARADAIVANSAYTAAGFREAGVRRQVAVLGNPVDLARFDVATVDRDRARAALRLHPSEFTLTVLAQITPWKGQEDAIRAVAEVRRAHPDVKLLLVGSAKFLSKATRYDNRAYLSWLQRLIGELGVEREVRFLSERDDVPTILRASDVLLVPSWEEPFGRSVIEAMAMRVPVIATNVGGPAEVISDGIDGILLPPRAPSRWASAIIKLIDSPSLRDRLAEHGWLRSREFGVSEHVAALLRLYEQVLEERGKLTGGRSV